MVISYQNVNQSPVWTILNQKKDGIFKKQNNLDDDILLIILFLQINWNIYTKADSVSTYFKILCIAQKQIITVSKI
jgi:hypothetical protein